MAQDDKWYLKDEQPPNLHMWIFRHMAMGAVYTALVLMGILFVILVFRSIAFILPEDPFAAIDAGQRALSALV